jgi:uncharacterized DUF497 family protein
MDWNIVFKESAFKHGYTEEDIYQVIQNRLYDNLLDEGSNRYLLIGSDHNGNLVEVMYNILDNGKVRIFHAMKCHKAYSCGGVENPDCNTLQEQQPVPLGRGC